MNHRDRERERELELDRDREFDESDRDRERVSDRELRTAPLRLYVRRVRVFFGHLCPICRARFKLQA